LIFGSVREDSLIIIINCRFVATIRPIWCSTSTDLKRSLRATDQNHHVTQTQLNTANLLAKQLQDDS